MFNKNFYEILNVKSIASTDEIKSSFRKLAQIHHPDKNNNSTESQIVFQIIYKAYSTLISPEKRDEYDIYLKTSSVVNKNFNAVHIVSEIKNNTLIYLSTQFNYILWEIEDILKSTEKFDEKKVISGYTINQWLLKILSFIDKWVLIPSGFIDYFYEARKIKGKGINNSMNSNVVKGIHNPYVNIYDYFYDIRKRMNKFIDSINLNDVMQVIISGFQVRIIDSIMESQMLSYHYLGYLNSVIKDKITVIRKFNHSNKCYEEESRELLNEIKK